jgi:hypothetical protein
MNKREREARLERAKQIGRRAYRLLIACDIEGLITYEGEDKHLRTFEEGVLSGKMLVPSRSQTAPNEFSEIIIRASGRKVLEIRWDTAQSFRVILRAWRLAARFVAPLLPSTRCCALRAFHLDLETVGPHVQERSHCRRRGDDEAPASIF